MIDHRSAHAPAPLPLPEASRESGVLTLRKLVETSSPSSKTPDSEEPEFRTASLALPELRALERKFRDENVQAARDKKADELIECAEILRLGPKELGNRLRSYEQSPRSQEFANRVIDGISLGTFGTLLVATYVLGLCAFGTSLTSLCCSGPVALVASLFVTNFLALVIEHSGNFWRRVASRQALTPSELAARGILKEILKEALAFSRGKSFTPQQVEKVEELLRQKRASQLETEAAAIRHPAQSATVRALD